MTEFNDEIKKTEVEKTEVVKNQITSAEKAQTIIINQEKKETNSLGTAGFVLAIISLFAGCLPFVGWFVWFLGLVFSIIGLFKKPRGLAIAGVIISLIGIILLIFVFSSLALLGASGALSEM